jgi:hypothetical protein
MINLIVPASLVNLLPDEPSNSVRRSVPLSSGPWTDVAAEIRERLPVLAERVLTDSNHIARGFVLVVNDKIVAGDQIRVNLCDGDNISVIAQLAGG